MLALKWFFAILLIRTARVDAALDLGFGDDVDLTHFVTRPEIRSPRYNVSVYNAEATTSGYWFVAPYAKILQEVPPEKYYQPCQTGPHIYDGDGELIWSGACMVWNQNTCDFRVWEDDGLYALTGIMYGVGNDKGHAVVMDNSYRVANVIEAPKAIEKFNMHELTLADRGKTALHIIGRSRLMDVSKLDLDQEAGWVCDNGFREVVVNTGETSFEWWLSDHISLLESTKAVVHISRQYPNCWNAFHMNSVEKDPSGDYLISMRHTDSVLKISGVSGNVLWRLGGTNSSFHQGDFNFSRQHDVRYVKSNRTTTIISLLDNASDPDSQTSQCSSALIIALETETTPMKATLQKRYIRPDRELSRLRGNFQLLPNGNAFVGWSDNAYISEYTAEGELVMEARFFSKRFVTYRAYKHNYTGNPLEPPVLKALAFGASLETSTTVLYVSWNGATRVRLWNFYRHKESTNSSLLIGSATRTGFETMFQLSGYESKVYAEALDLDGKPLGRSSVETATRPNTWKFQQIGNLSDTEVPSTSRHEPEAESVEFRKSEL